MRKTRFLTALHSQSSFAKKSLIKRELACSLSRETNVRRCSLFLNISNLEYTSIFTHPVNNIFRSPFHVKPLPLFAPFFLYDSITSYTPFNPNTTT